MHTPCGEKIVSFHRLFAALDQKLESQHSQSFSEKATTTKTAIERHMGGFQSVENMNGIKRIQKCRQGLEALDRRGWNRSFHQRLFHEEYLKSCTRVFFKRDGQGAFSRAHSRVLEVNGWDSTPQEILVSTPRYNIYQSSCNFNVLILIQAFWENNLCLYVCSCYDFFMPQHGTFHL
jgi:hypothetical protein